MSGAHHGNVGTDDVASTADTIGNSYRFLAGIKGLEHVNHNYNETNVLHNEYLGDADSSVERDDDATSTYANTDSINFFCAQCHGDFHAKIDADATFGNPWVRHPTDIVLPNSAPFTEYNNDGGGTMGTYNLVVPVARGGVPATSGSAVANNSAADTGGIVMCLSCHRAHGSPYDDMLRFDYTAMTVGGASTTGCMVCHTDKN
jgi:predicted CXXCH cytochrome family protein